MTDKTFLAALLCILAGVAIAEDSPWLAFFIIWIALEWWDNS
jgi:hypothetical protein